MTQTRITGSFNHTHAKQHFPYAFTMPNGATRLDVKFTYEPMHFEGQPVPNDLSLTVCDPDGVRGARHSNPDRDLFITASAATPGYVPGPLQPGVWTIWIDTHRIMPPDTLTFTLDLVISTNPQPDVATPAWPKASVAPRGPGWYRGDLHGHTIHSDGAWDVPDFAAYGRAYHLDFVTLTDHNTVSPLAQLDSLAGDDLLTIGGMELTTYFGHALALGTRHWQEWRTGLNGLTMPDLAARVMDGGAQYVIAHPKSIGDPYCTGCDWGYPEMMPGNARRVEVWNGPWAGDSGNEQALQLWYAWLNQGLRMVATGGTDIHGPLTDPRPGFNHVYAAELSEHAVLDGISQGHSYISSGPRVTLNGTSEDGQSAMMGDLLPGRQLSLRATWTDADPGCTLRFIVDGAPRQESRIDAEGTLDLALSAAEAHWCAVEIRAADGELRAITNPIFFGDADQWR